MVVERTRYILNIVPIWKDQPEEGEPIFLKHIRDSEPDNLGYNFSGESLSESVMVSSEDSLSRFFFNPNRGPMNRDLIEVLHKEEIKKAKLQGDMACLLVNMLGYRERWSWKPGKRRG
jgi:hypothetical protein